jgi:hypothetical protein
MPEEPGGSGNIVTDQAVANVVHAMLADDEAVIVMDND